jgi:hypothetical protein
VLKIALTGVKSVPVVLGTFGFRLLAVVNLPNNSNDAVKKNTKTKKRLSEGAKLSIKNNKL